MYRAAGFLRISLSTAGWARGGVFRKFSGSSPNGQRRVRLVALAIAGTLMMTGLTWGRTPVNKERAVTVYIAGEESVPFRICACGESIAAHMFREIGVNLNWRRRKPSAAELDRGQALFVEIAAKPHGMPSPTVAVTLPHEGSSIKVYYESIRWVEERPHLAPTLFAHVLAHEIAHALQQVNRHSETGILKAHWTEKDYSQMRVAPLHFENYDVELIHLGLDERHRRRLARDASPASRIKGD